MLALPETGFQEMGLFRKQVTMPNIMYTIYF
jgi:hypothetical protein